MVQRKVGSRQDPIKREISSLIVGKATINFC